MGVNYIWDLVIKARRAGIAKEELVFKAAKVYSPYMELSLEAINAKTVDKTVEVNPFYRFEDIFRELFDVNYTGESELRQVLFDIVTHLLAEIDLTQGMNKREYYIRFVLRDLEAGLFGSQAAENIKLFTRDEQEIIAGNLLRLYETGEAVYLLRDTMRKIFPHSTIYANCEEKDELLLYVGQAETDAARARLALILDIFLPVRFQTEIYWRNHFGILDVEETMQIDHIALY
ncbi:iron-dependent peroxidase [Brevibacillus gelatini]|uniref:Iron-dependent peroxidase n=1 Tax=Brevibacillus gelatini TaxID=1655277 RepID=A0A3M8ANK6_9BACL|nr:iron-dependent peroxidase [Brevibacillus gelatini]RNB52780.1 iron-dependent peroxidase [Brevibacillus gelatini]